uniref:Probable membrane transporter protein n=1 Tax=Thermorudis peleae TaxID=1382356 RepID=A0A831T8I7_9BACT
MLPELWAAALGVAQNGYRGSMELFPTVAGGLVAAAAAVLAGMTGFGYALLSTPVLLALGYPPATVVAANLSIALVTRITVAWRLRSWATWRRVGLLGAGSLPGLALGARLQAALDPEALRPAIGAAVVVAALLMLRARPQPRRDRQRGGTVLPMLTGFLSGVLGTTTSLSGVPLIFYLSRLGLEPARFIADLAVYFVLTNAAGLFLMLVNGALAPDALLTTTAIWLPGALLGTLLGVRLGTRLPAPHFRTLVLAAALGAGVLTVASAFLR